MANNFVDGVNTTVSGSSYSGKGYVTVSGMDASGHASSLSVNNLSVGCGGDVGTLNITNGGQVTSITMTIGNMTNATPTLLIDGGSLTTNTLAIYNASTFMPIVRITNPTAANGGGYALNLGGSGGSSTINYNIADGLAGDGASGSIAGGPGGAGGIRKSGAGTLTLSAANTFSGGMQVDGGVVKVADTNGNALQNSTAILNFNNGLDVTSPTTGGVYNVTLGGLAGSGNFDYGNTNVFVGNNNASTTYSGALANFRSGGGYNGVFHKIGAGTFTLTNAASSVNGYVFFDAGTSILTGANSTSYASLTTTHGAYVGDGGTATLNVVGTNGSGHASTLDGTNQNFFVGIGGTGTLNLTSGGVAIAADTYLGYNAGSVGVVNVTGGDGHGLFSTLNTPDFLDLGYNGSGTVNVTGGGQVNAHTTTLGDGGTGTMTVSGTDGSGNASTLNVNNYALNLGRGAGSGTLNVTNGGKVIGVDHLFLSDTQNSSSTLNINGGSVTTNYIGAGVGNTPTVLLTNPSVGNGGGYALTVGDSQGSASTMNFPIADATGGAGGIDKVSISLLTLGGANTFSGGVKIDGGEVGVSADSNLGTGGVILNGGQLRWTGGSETLGRTVTLGSAASGSGFDVTNAATNLKVNQAFSGTGSLTKTGAGTLTLSSASTYSGGTTVSGGTLVASGTSLGTGAVNVGAGTTLAVGELANTGNSPLSVGTLTLSSLTVAASTASPELTFNLGASGVSDRLFLTGTGSSAFAAAGDFDIGFASATGGSLGSGSYTLFTFPNLSSAANLPSLNLYHAVPTGNLGGLHTSANPFSYVVNGNGVNLVFGISSSDAMPEPSSLGLLLVVVLPGGVVGVRTLRRRQCVK